MTISNIEINSKAIDSELIFATETKKLSDFIGQTVVLYFYPKDDTPGCTIEANDFAQLMPEFSSLNTTIIGVSKDDLKKHKKFIDKYCLPFALASDIEGKLCAAFGTWVEKSMYGKKYMGIQRSTFLIDEKGIVRKIWRNVSVKGHAQEVLSCIKESKH